MKKFKIPSYLKRVRYCLGGVNCVYLLTGLLLLLCGISVLLINKQYDLFITQKFRNVPAFAIATGAIIIFTSALGFYAAFSEEFRYVALYVVISVIVLIFEMSVVIIAFGLRNDSNQEIRAAMTQAQTQYLERREVARVWDYLQKDFECCGVTGRHNWPSLGIPISCCYIDYGTISPFYCTLSNARTLGCASALSDWLEFNVQALAATALFVFCLQIINTGVAAWMAYRTKFEEIELES